MNILILTEFFPKSADEEVTGGVEIRSYHIAKELAKKNKVTVITSRLQGTPREEYIEGIHVIRCGKKRGYSQGGAYLSRISFIIDAYITGLKVNANLVEGHSFLSYIPAMWISKKKKVPAIATYHDVWLGQWVKNAGLVSGIFGELAERYVLANKGRRWTCLVANSEATKKKLISIGVPSSKVHVVYSAIAIDQFNSMKVAKGKNPIIIGVGRLVGYKRFDDLIRATSLVAKKVPNIKCRIIGCGPEEGKLRRLIKELDLEDKVELKAEILRRSETIKLLKESHVFSLPSVVEGMGLVTAEAIAAGLPYVNSAIPPTVEITEGGKGGLLYQPGNWEELAEKIINLITNERLYGRCRLEQKKLLRKFSINVMLEKLSWVYEKFG